MKTLYSSTFLSLIIAFLAMLGASDNGIQIAINPTTQPSFSNIIAPLPKILPSTESDAYLKSSNIQVDIFNTFGCVDCDNFAMNTLKNLSEKYSDNNKVDINIHIIPNIEVEEEIYPAIGLKCAEEIDKYWDLYNALYNSNEPLNNREVDLIAQEIKLPVTQFRSCLNGDKYNEDILEEIAYANKKGVVKKPTILIEGYILLGNQPIENIDKVINELLN